MIPPNSHPEAEVSRDSLASYELKDCPIDLKSDSMAAIMKPAQIRLHHHHQDHPDSCMHQPNSMDSAGSSGSNNSEYAYRPLACSTVKLHRTGSTGTTGDEEYPTSDEDDLYVDDLDCSAISGAGHLHSAFPKSDLDRAATDLFGYQDEGIEEIEPTGLFDEDEIKFSCESRTKPTSTYFSEKLLTRSNALARRRKSGEGDDSPSECKQTLDNRLADGESSSSPEKDSGAADISTAAMALTHNGDDIDIDEQYGDYRADEGKGNENGGNGRQRAKNADTCGSSKSLDEYLDQNSTIDRLRAELLLSESKLLARDEEVTKLSRIRQEVESELEELTASLFQEAHNMVHEANQRKASAEKLLEESRMKVEVLAAEVNALKTLVLTSTPSRPNPHLHPQITIGGSQSNHHSDDGNFGKLRLHRRSPSHFNLKYGRESSPPDSPQHSPLTNGSQAITDNCNIGVDNHRQHNHHNQHSNRHSQAHQKIGQDQEGVIPRGDDQKHGVIVRQDSQGKDSGTRDQRDSSILEVDPRVHAEFLRWKLSPCLDKSEPFVERIFREDIDLCLDFPNKELGSRVRQSVLDGIIFVEAVGDKAKSGFPRKCALLEVPKYCQYRMRLGDQENQWHSISQICRNRIIGVCDFLNYLRYIERGLVKSSANDIFWEITRLRKEMVLARLGLAVSA